MNCVAKFAGIKKRVSPKGTVYADIFCHSILSDGSVDVEQCKLRTFSSDVIAKCEMLKKDDNLLIDLAFKDATIVGVELYEEDDV